jgi:hypothetical protein
VSRGSALLTLRLPVLLLVALVVESLACRSAVAPPSPIEGDSGLPLGVVPSTPGGVVPPGCPRRECPLPGNVIAGLEQRMVDRLDKEREAFLDGFVLLRTQRDGFVAALQQIVEQRRAAPAEGAVGDDADAGPATDAGPCDWSGAARTAAAEPVTKLLEETVGWLGALGSQSASLPAGGGSGGRVPARQTPGSASAGIAPAQVGTVREGQWILPVVRMMAALRSRFAAVAAAQSDAVAMEGALRTSEARLRSALDALAGDVVSPSPDTPNAAGTDPTGPSASPDGGAGAVHRERVRDEEPCRAARERSAAIDAHERARALRDLRQALDALEVARPSSCTAGEGSSVCRPAPVDVWTGSEFTLVGPDDQGEIEKLLERLDEFLHP